MGKVSTTPQALRFYAITVNRDALFYEAEKLICKEPGSRLAEFGPFYFSELTAYYRPEMGENLFKKFILLKDAVSLENAYQAKLQSNEWEKQFITDGRRSVNIDPGFLTLFNFSLLTTKGFSHRIYLAHGIWSELTLIYKGGRFVIQPWTYPDYQTEDALTFFSHFREMAR